MASQTDIVNIALTLLGCRTIASLSAENDIARRASVLWTPTLEEVLGACEWGFARRIVELTLISETEDGVQPIQGWDYIYAMPASCLVVRKVFPDGEADRREPYKFTEVMEPDTKAKSIATDVEEAFAEYTYKVTDTTQFDAAFVQALSSKLAAALAMPLTGDKQLAQMMAANYAQAISEAQKRNYGRVNPKVTKGSSYLDAR